MTPIPLRTTTLAAAALLLASCGGGGETPMRGTAAASPQRSAAAAPTERAAALAVIGAKELFDWAQYKYPELLAGSYVDLPTPIPYEGKVFTVRFIPGKGAYLGLDNTGGVWALAPFTNNALQGFGPLSGFEPLIQADSCNVYPGSCGNSQPPGPLNGCTMPAAQALVPGNRWVLNYETTGSSTGTTETTGVVDGNQTFEGQSAVRISGTSVIRITVQGRTTTSTAQTRSYEQAADGGFTRSLGVESESDFGGIAGSNRLVFNPAVLNSEFGLAPGQSFTKTTAGTSTSTIPGLPPTPVAFSEQTTYTYETRETVTVRGRSYDACRYRSVSPEVPGSYTLDWHVFGKGISVRTQVFTGTTLDSTTELVSGTFNGAPI